MKLHDLRPAEGSRKSRTRVGRGIAAGKGKTAGRGTKGQKARAGSSIPPWFEGGQTPIHIRIPKLRGFKNRFKIDYEVVNVGRIGALVESGAFDVGKLPPTARKAKAPAPITINQELLRAVGLVSTLDKPLKILGHGDVSAPLFVVADAFSKSAVAKIEAAGGSIQLLVIPSGPLAALGLEGPEAVLAAAPTSLAEAPPAMEPPAGPTTVGEAPAEEAPARAPRTRSKKASPEDVASTESGDAPGQDA